jgi:hypothetical protein
MVVRDAVLDHIHEVDPLEGSEGSLFRLHTLHDGGGYA